MISKTRLKLYTIQSPQRLLSSVTIARFFLDLQIFHGRLFLDRGSSLTGCGLCVVGCVLSVCPVCRCVCGDVWGCICGHVCVVCLLCVVGCAFVVALLVVFVFFCGCVYGGRVFVIVFCWFCVVLWLWFWLWWLWLQLCVVVVVRHEGKNIFGRCAVAVSVPIAPRRRARRLPSETKVVVGRAIRVCYGRCVCGCVFWLCIVCLLLCVVGCVLCVLVVFVVVEVLDCPLRSGACWRGPVVLTAIWRLLLRSGGAE